MLSTTAQKTSRPTCSTTFPLGACTSSSWERVPAAAVQPVSLAKP
ncbi:rCG64281 [Rattus norvegicus]|uniref:RCG64281 n=1 Tax=Rattus norvegicus TaxID=10116 RepID=A6JGU5_RAT|nr:rCG64281 [Rattus norvegicus]